MARNVIRIEATPILPTRLKVAAYCRVSLGKEHMLQSLAAQVSHYSKYIQSRGEWEYVGVYADEAKTGTLDTRPEFQRLLADCRDGKVGLILTKTISRFARNTVTLLETVRELKDLGIGVLFEEQNIHTLTSDGELMLTILASYAQEEVLSVSENIKWRTRDDMKKGKFKPQKVFGYESVDGKLVIKPDEAEVVRLIFAEFLNGLGQTRIANKLNEMGIITTAGNKWRSSTIRRVLMNPKMCGNLLHQQRYISDPITKKIVVNKGELPMFFIENAHEGIVSVETYEAVQAEYARRAEKFKHTGRGRKNAERPSYPG